MSILANDIPVALDIPIENISYEWLASIGFVNETFRYSSWTRTKYGYRLILRHKTRMITGVSFWEVLVIKARKGNPGNLIKTIPVATVNEFISIVNKYQPHEHPL